VAPGSRALGVTGYGLQGRVLVHYGPATLKPWFTVAGLQGLGLTSFEKMRTCKSADDFARMRESRICWLIHGITGEIVGLSTC